MPNTWFQPAGLRKLPMKSEPSATGSILCARATAAPPLLPPADLPGFHAFKVAPNTSLKVCEPKPNSGVLVLPITMQPAAFMRAAIKPSCAGMKSRHKGDPMWVGKPATCAKSLTACGMPCIQLRHAHNGIALRVVRVDLIQVRLHDLAARHLSGVNGLRQFAG